MKPSAALLADLHALDDALDEPRHLADQLTDVLDLLGDAVPTLLAVTITVTIDHHTVTLTATDGDPAQAQATIAIDIPGTHPSAPAHRLVAYATDPAAFTDLAIDAVHGLSLHPDHVTHNTHLDPTRWPPAGNSVAGHSTINQAIGVLIDHGHTPDTARTTLEHHAATAGIDLITHAHTVIASAHHDRDQDRPSHS